MATMTDRMSYADLYARWEAGNWRATEIDFTRDREDWNERFTEFERTAALWNYALFFWGEDAVTDGLSPYIDAAPLEQQKYFLATQQVDEARHAVFFDRFMAEVVGVEGDTPGERLTAIKPQLTWGFRKVFDRLETMAGELRADPSIPRLAAAVALYHVIIEASLAQPGQHFINSYLHERDLLPGFREGMDNVAADEQRHIGFGVKLLSDLRQMDPEVPHAVADLLREVVPWTAAVLMPPGWDESYVEVFGSSMHEIGLEGVTSMETKLRTAGLALDELPGPPIFAPDLTPDERVRNGYLLTRGGILGPKNGPPSRDPETMAALFRMVDRSLDHSAAPERGGTIAWEFTDAEPWHIVVDNGSSHAAPGRPQDPTVTLRCRYEDWADVVGGRTDPLKLTVRGRLRTRGDLRWLWRARGLFPR